MDKRQDFSVLLSIVTVVISCISLVHVAVFNIFASLSLYLMLAVAIALSVLRGSVPKENLLFLLTFIVYLPVSLIITQGGMGSIVTFLVPLILINGLENVNLTKINREITSLFCVVTMAFVFIMSFFYARDYYWYRYNWINPNTMGMFSMFCFMLWFSFADLSKIQSKLMLGAISVFTFFGMYNLRSRGTMLAVIVFVIFNLIPKKFITKKRFMIFTALLIAAGVIIPFVYMALYNNGIDLIIFGKNLYTGREAIWQKMFSAFREGGFVSWIFGLGSKAELIENHDLNVHNNFFAVIVNFGVIGFGLFVAFLWRKISDAASAIDDTTVRRLLFMFLASALVLGFSEVTTLWPPVYAFICLSLAAPCKAAKEKAIANKMPGNEEGKI